MQDIQAIQEEEYGFPYHYLPTNEKSFQLTKVWRWGMQYMATIVYLAEELKKMEFEKFIDVGCGDGRLVKEVSRYFPGQQVSGIDTSEAAVSLAKALNSDLDFKNIDVANVKLREQYDIATCIEVIEHIPPDRLGAFIDCLSKVLKPNGCLLLTTPTTNKRVSKKHYQHFEYGQIKGLLEPFFDIKTLRYIHTPNWQSEFLMRVLTNKWYSLNHPRLSDFIFNYYYKNVFLSESTQGHRFFVVATRK